MFLIKFDSIMLVPVVLGDVHVIDCLTYPSSTFGSGKRFIFQDNYGGKENQTWTFVEYWNVIVLSLDSPVIPTAGT